MDEVFERLMDSAGVPDEDRAGTLAKLHALKVRYPRETPARLFARAKREGAPIPLSRCPHRVRRGECVACDGRVGARSYFTANGEQAHTTPLCAPLASASPEPIESIPASSGDGREPCPICVKTVTRRATTHRTPPARTPQARAAASSLRPLVGPAPLDPESPPAEGDRIEWGGYSGTVTRISERGVTVTVEGVTMTAPWGDRATVRKQTR